MSNTIKTIKTKKNKKNYYRKKKRFFTKKKGKGGSSEGKKNIHLKEENETAIRDIKKEVEDEKTKFSNENSILAKTEDVALGVAANTVDNVGDLLGVDLTDPKLVEKNKEEIEQISKNAAEMGNIVVESIEPFTKPLIDKSIKASGEILSDVGETGVKVLLNTVEEIPGVGILVGTARSLGNIGDAVVSSVNAGSEVVTSAADTINASVKNFDRLIKEKEDVLNRTKSSIDEFTGGSRFTSRSMEKSIKKNKNVGKTKKRGRI
jgi:hypothetical protein